MEGAGRISGGRTQRGLLSVSSSQVIAKASSEQYRNRSIEAHSLGSLFVFLLLVLEVYSSNGPLNRTPHPPHSAPRAPPPRPRPPPHPAAFTDDPYGPYVCSNGRICSGGRVGAGVQSHRTHGGNTARDRGCIRRSRCTAYEYTRT